ncbi:MAG TPA: competence protein ComEA, partial [Chromatiales bacterium]|nr:competence protein ComEA [Chromatiales bacterium]
VGPHLAEAIVQYRKAHGPFASLEQLLQVKGIGPRVLERNRDRLTVGRREDRPQPK